MSDTQRQLGANLAAPGRYERLERLAYQDWECKDCGSLVIDREAHDRWHLMVEPPDVPRLRVYR
jgi:hypothetical protein